eukprot:c22405_g3_i1 orf=510-1043(+)
MRMELLTELMKETAITLAAETLASGHCHDACHCRNPHCTAAEKIPSKEISFPSSASISREGLWIWPQKPLLILPLLKPESQIELLQREPLWKEGKLLHFQAPFILKKAFSLLRGAEKVAEGTRQEDRRQHLMQSIADRRRMGGWWSGGNIREGRERKTQRRGGWERAGKGAGNRGKI